MVECTPFRTAIDEVFVDDKATILADELGTLVIMDELAAATLRTDRLPRALALALGFFHERQDLIYLGYMAVVGALVEYCGVWSGQWHYPGDSFGGVPLWFATMWGGIGLFTRRLILPLTATGASRVGGYT